MSLAYTLPRSREKSLNRKKSNCNTSYNPDDPAGNQPIIRKLQVHWLVAKAFLRVLSKKQTLFPKTLNWLVECVKATNGEVDDVFRKAVEDEEVGEIFKSMRY
ncbi:hypothetical protein ABW19_dt0206473 [Dactylella cylindrospora]|nr:hypothetical protein ABW19_dt0206473 [Dactylella cylindrospora]